MVKYMDERIDEVTAFTRDEYLQALRLIMPPDVADEVYESTFKVTPGEVEPGRVISPDMLDLLALASPSCAERARQFLQIGEAEASARWEAVREALATASDSDSDRARGADGSD